MDEWRCICTRLEHKHLNEHCPKPATTYDGYCQQCHDRIVSDVQAPKLEAENMSIPRQMSTQPPPFHDENSPVPAWAGTVTERRLMWLAQRHPKMNSIKRHDWAVRASQPERENTKR